MVAIFARLVTPSLAERWRRERKGGVTECPIVPDATFGHTVTASANPSGADVYV